MEILILSGLARTPMHGYEIKLELRYKHVRWWAKCEHAHIYVALARLQRKGLVRTVRRAAGSRRRVLAITPAGRRHLLRSLEAVGGAMDSTYFDVDLFLSGAFALDRRRAVAVLERRREALQAQLAEARDIVGQMTPFVPAVGRLIMAHRVEHLAREVEFAATAGEALRAEAAWGAFLGSESIGDFIRRRGTRLEAEAKAVRGAKRRAREEASHVEEANAAPGGAPAAGLSGSRTRERLRLRRDQRRR